MAHDEPFERWEGVGREIARRLAAQRTPWEAARQPNLQRAAAKAQQAAAKAQQRRARRKPRRPPKHG